MQNDKVFRIDDPYAFLTVFSAECPRFQSWDECRQLNRYIIHYVRLKTTKNNLK